VEVTTGAPPWTWSGDGSGHRRCDDGDGDAVDCDGCDAVAGVDGGGDGGDDDCRRRDVSVRP